MAVVIAVTQRKGGAGKTTIAVSVAAELHRLTNDVGMIDGDTQASACQWAQPGNLRFPVYELSAETRPVADWANLVRQMPHGIILVDCAPNDRSMGAAIAVADLVIVPCTPSGMDFEATIRTLDIVRQVRSSRARALQVLLVPNRVDRRTLEGQQLIEELATLGEPVSPSVGSRAAFVRAFSMGQSVADFALGSLADTEIKILTSMVQQLLEQGR